MMKKKRLAAVVLSCSLLLSGCGSRKEPEPYSSPNFVKQEATKDTSESSEEPVTELSNVEEDENENENEPVNYSELSDGEAVSQPELEEPVDSSVIVGYYNWNDYYNPFAGLAIMTDGDQWRLYNAYQVSEVTDFTEDEIQNIWSGKKSPYYLERTPCAVAYHFHTGSSIVLSYINPKMFYMGGVNPKKYLEMAAEEYEGLEVLETKYLGQDYYVLDIPEEQNGFGRRVEFMTEKDDLLISITYTLQDEMDLEDMAEHLVQLQK